MKSWLGPDGNQFSARDRPLARLRRHGRPEFWGRKVPGVLVILSSFLISGCMARFATCSPEQSDRDARPTTRQHCTRPSLDAPATTPALTTWQKEESTTQRANEIPRPNSVTLQARLDGDPTDQIPDQKVPVPNNRKHGSAEPELPKIPGPTMTLAEVTRRTIEQNPGIAAINARVLAAFLGIDVAKTAYFPQATVSAGFGDGTEGYVPIPLAPLSANPYTWAARTDGGFTVKQTIFDFGATKNDVLRAEALRDAEQLTQIDQTEDTIQQLSIAYLKVLESQELIDLANENFAALTKIANLVNATQKDGVSTMAEVKRVTTRIVEARSALRDAESDQQSAIFQFRRLTRLEPGRLLLPPNFSNAVPASADHAIELAVRENPALLHMQATSRSLDYQRKSQIAQGMPTVNLRADATTSNYWKSHTEVNGRAMIVIDYKFYDAGANFKLAEQFNARRLEAELKERDSRDGLEMDIRQFYTVLRSSREKLDSLREGLDASKKAKEIFLAQFKEGKRTLFELLDIQSTFYNSKKAEINNRYNERRSIYGILRSLGQLTRTIISQAK
jgi:adhesin transport system outer membrane protein